MQYQEVTISALISANIKKVWQYWTEPKHIVNWNNASEDWHCPHATNNLIVGGKYSARMEAKDESFGFDFEAIYDEVHLLHKITYTITDGRKVTTTFEDLGENTKVTTLFEAEDQNPVEMQQAGWQAILDNFKTYTENT